jgi:hypothetical protein
MLCDTAVQAGVSGFCAYTAGTGWAQVLTDTHSFMTAVPKWRYTALWARCCTHDTCVFRHTVRLVRLLRLFR